MKRLLIATILFALFIPAANGQDDQRTLQEAMRDLAENGDVTALPVLRDAFDAESDKGRRQKIASILVRFGEPDEKFYLYLEHFAILAVESEIPSFMKYDEHGKSVRGEMAEEFLEWCRLNNRDPGEVLGELMHELPSGLLHLTMAATPRAAPLLLRGLRSRNELVVLISARGLAILGDTAAIDPIIEECERRPAAVAKSLAFQALLFFDEPRAQAAVEKYMDDPVLVEKLREGLAKLGRKRILGF